MVSEEFAKCGVDIFICGNTNKITAAMLESGCDVPVDAPKENVLAFMDAVREYGPTRLGEKK